MAALFEHVREMEANGELALVSELTTDKVRKEF